MTSYRTENYCETGKYNIQGVYLLLSKEYIVHPNGLTAKTRYLAKVGMSFVRMYDRPDSQTRNWFGTHYVDLEGEERYNRDFKPFIHLREKCYLPNYINPDVEESHYHNVLSKLGQQRGLEEWYYVTEEEYNRIYSGGLAYLRKHEMFTWEG